MTNATEARNEGSGAVPSGFILKLYQMVNGAPDEVISVSLKIFRKFDRKKTSDRWDEKPPVQKSDLLRKSFHHSFYEDGFRMKEGFGYACGARFPSF